MRIMIVLCTFLLIAGPVNAQRKIGSDRKELRRGKAEARRNFLAALKLFRANDLFGAEALLKDNVEDGHIASMGLLAKIQMLTGRTKEAQSVLQRAVQLEPKNRRLQLALAEHSLQNGKSLKALSLLNRSAQGSDDEDDPVSGEETNELKKRILSAARAEKKQAPVYYQSTTPSTPDPAWPSVDPAKRLRVAVFAFENHTTGTDSSLGRSTAEMMTTSLVQSNCYQVVERLHLDKILTEQDFQLSDAVDAETAVEAGLLMGIDAIVVGSLTGEKTIEIDSRMIGVQNGAALSAAFAKAAGQNRLRESVAGITHELTKAVYAH